MVVGQRNLVSSFLKKFPRGVSLNLAEFSNIFETIVFWNIGLHNFTNEILGTWFEDVPIVVGQPNLVSRFLKKFPRGVSLNLAEFSNNFETIGFWNIGSHNFTKAILGAWFRNVSIDLGQPNLVSSFLKQFSTVVSLHLAKFSNIYSIIGFQNFKLTQLFQRKLRYLFSICSH